MGKTLLAEIDVLTINKMFARWLAKDRILAEHFDRWCATDRVTVSLLKQKEV
jgi:hypothetical protein